MKMESSVFIAFRFLFGNRKLRHQGSGLGGAILGIGISLVPLLLALLVSDGMIQGITRRYMETKSYHIQVALPDAFSRKEASPGLEAINALPGVRGSFLETNGSAIIVSAAASHATLVRSVSPEFYSDPGTMEYLRSHKGDLSPRNNHSIVLGSSLAALLGVGIGDQVTIVSTGANPERYPADPDSIPLPSPRLSFFRVTGIVGAGYRDIDAIWSFVTMEAAERVLSPGTSYEFMGIKVDKPFSNSLGSQALGVSTSLSKVYPEWFESRLVRTWTEIERSLYRSFATTKSMLLYIMGIALIVAAINLGSALSTFVTERNMEIAILRSMGAGDSQIRFIFLGAGLLTGGAGTVLGVAVGLLLSASVNGIIAAAEWLLNGAGSILALIKGQPYHSMRLLDPGYYLERIPISPDYIQIFAIAVLSVALCELASIVPAMKATRISVQTLVRKT